MTNLLQETIEILAENGKTVDDVRFILSAPQEAWFTPGEKEWCNWIEFVGLADRQYDSGYGGAEVVQWLKVVGDDWWLERHEYDGSEWWEFKSIPQKPETHNNFIHIFQEYI